MHDRRTEFRSVMGRVPTGVTVVASRTPEGDPYGLTVNSVTSVSLDPLLVLVCLSRSAATLPHVLEEGAFAISVLGADDAELARRFAEGGPETRFEGLEVASAVTGCPILARAIAWLDCRVHDTHEAGDHVIVIGEVLDSDQRAGAPLVFHRGAYRRMPT